MSGILGRQSWHTSRTEGKQKVAQPTMARHNLISPLTVFFVS